ncbi:MAG TPA: RNA polymerase sigma factor [Puia sp.]|nr:RNA polymerase sigma factor [Puia sp.]
MAELTDENIMIKVKDGQLADLAVLFDRYNVKLYHFFLKLTLDKAISEDLTQNVFCRIIKYRHTYNISDGTFKSWVYRMARNLHFDHCKQQKKIEDQFKKLENYHDNIPNMDQPRAEGEFKKLDWALLQLQPDQRELIMLSRFSGLRYEEISRIHGKSVLAIRVQVHRAINHLRKIYFKQQEERL